MNVQSKTYNLQVLDRAELPLSNTPVVPQETLLQTPRLPVYTYRGQEVHQPVVTSGFLIDLINSHRLTGNGAYLERAVSLAEQYLDTAQHSETTVFFPYDFDCNLHRIHSERLVAPWYSGMAQGVSLRVFVRLYQATRDPRYIEVAQKVFNTFLRLGNDNCNPWVAHVDEQGYYWIEEYPAWPADHTLNGFIHAIFGIYEFWLQLRTAEIRELLEACLTTVEHNVDRFRKPGDISYYCLKHKFRNAQYHRAHVRQLRKLHRMTGEFAFRQMAEAFRQDHPARFARLRSFERYLDFVKWHIRAWVRWNPVGPPERCPTIASYVRAKRR